MVLEHLRVKIYYYLQNITIEKILLFYFCTLSFTSVLSQKKYRENFFYNCILSWWITVIATITLLGRSRTVENNFGKIFSSFIELSQGHMAILYDIIFNIILFVPLGILIRIKCQTYKTIFIVMSGSLFIEIFQFVTSCGVLEVSDLLANTIGGGIGIILFDFITRTYFIAKCIVTEKTRKL